MFEFLKRKTLVTGIDKDGNPIEVEANKKEEICEDTFLELTCGIGNDYDYITNEGGGEHDGQ